MDIVRVDDDDEVLMMTKGGKIQRIRAAEISVVGRNTQGVRVMKTDDDQIAAVVRIPPEEITEEDEAAAEISASTESSETPETPQVSEAPEADDSSTDEASENSSED